jgi:hypothetical protein
VASGERECADRYEAIREVLATIQQPFTLLDLGAYTGYFAVRAASDFDCRVIAIDDNPRLPEISSSRITVINRRVAAADLRRLPHVDVVLALSVLHHLADWRSALADLMARRCQIIAEVPHPDEDWMRRAAARRELRAIHDATHAAAARELGVFERTSPKDGRIWRRPMLQIQGHPAPVTGIVFSGSGNNARSLRKYADDRLSAQLGYEPYPGSLNLRVDALDLGEPHVRWERKIGRNRRAYDAWRAWYGDVAGHVMIPTAKKQHQGTLEGWAPVNLRERLGVADGDQVTVEVEISG